MQVCVIGFIVSDFLGFKGVLNWYLVDLCVKFSYKMKDLLESRLRV